jgi:FAD dependent oxidoreductase
MFFRYFLSFCCASVLLFAASSSLFAQKKTKAAVPACDVLVISGGTGGYGAALQSARLGANTILCEASPWLGGMLSTAGVSATDGNHLLPSGIWEEFRQLLYKHYGGPLALETGWVSNCQFEPHIGDRFLKQMAAKEPNLRIRHGYTFKKILKTGNRVTGAVFQDAAGKEVSLSARVTIDATELGDAFAAAGAGFLVGTDSKAETGETFAPEKGGRVIQDLTWAAILKDFGPGADKTIPKPASFTPDSFRCCCTTNCDKIVGKVHACDKMLAYGRLPNEKYMINWPLKGNDYYADVIDATPAEREAAYQKAREHTLNFVYYIQTVLGYKNLGLAEDEFKTPDRLPYMPYNREGRRVKGLVQLNVHHLIQPFDQPLYRTGIAVGDYPLDHHHFKMPVVIEEEYPPIPSFNVPLGALVPAGVEGMVVADKGISVTHLVNGASRLQPCVLLTGQAAGALAATAALQNIMPHTVSVRTVQRRLLQNKAFLMPYLDVLPTQPGWAAIQRVGATGLLRGTGIPKDWANQTFFYPDTTLMNMDLLMGLQSWQSGFYDNVRLRPQVLTIGEATAMLSTLLQKEKKTYCAVAQTAKKQPDYLTKWMAQAWKTTPGLSNYNPERPITRRELAIVLDKAISPFSRKIDWKGEFVE